MCQYSAVKSSITRVHDDDRPFAWHYFDELADALEAIKAADLLELPFVLHKRERQTEDDDAVEIDYVVVLLPPGAEFEVAGDEVEAGDEEEE